MSCTSHEVHNQSAINLGNYLVESTLNNELFAIERTKHPNIVRIGDKLQLKLKELKPKFSSKCVSELEVNHQDREVTHRVIVSCNGVSLIGLRLNYDKKYSAFHILGYWTSGL